MAAFMTAARTLRNHWKKSTVLAVLSAWGGNWLVERYKADLLREEYCQQAQLFGQQLIYTTAKPLKATVFLNPAAKKGKAKKLFQKNAAPLLHLAGIDVEVVQTTMEGEAKDLAGALGQTDIIVIAGGDGTVAEVVTGLLRREDEREVGSRWPLGIIPVGMTNSLARHLYTETEADVRWMCNAAMAIIKGATRQVDVMSIQDEDQGRKSYAVDSIHWGPLRDAGEKATKFWYFGPLKHRFSYLWTGFTQENPARVSGHISYGQPKEVPVATPPVRDWWWFRLYNRLWPKPREPEPEVEEEEEIFEEFDFSAIEVSVETDNSGCARKGPPALNVRVGPKELSRTDFVKEGWARLSGEAHTEAYETNDIPVGEIHLKPELTEGETAWFTIDSERFEAMPVMVKLLPSKLRFFTDRPQSTQGAAEQR